MQGPNEKSSEVERAARAAADNYAKPAYQRTAAEQMLVSEFGERIKATRPAPRFEVAHAPRKPAAIAIDHTDKFLGAAAFWNAFGTTNPDFADWLLHQLVNAGCQATPSTPLEERDLNGAAAAMAGIGPRNETEAMLAAQMVAVHAAAMGALRRLKGCETIPQQDSNGNLATKLLRTFTAQVEALQRLRGKGQQTVRVEHVTVNAGGQAIVGTVTGGTGGKEKSEEQPDAKQLTHAPGQTLPGEIEADKEPVPVARG